MGVGAAIAGAAVVGAVATTAASSNAADAATNAAQIQAHAADNAAAQQEAQFEQTNANLQPYRALGSGAIGELSQLTGTNTGGNPLTAPLTKPFNPTMADLEATPGYQFTKDQGLKSVQNSFAAQGLGSSGAAIKGGTNYAEGLASTTFQQQFNNYLAQNQQIYNMLAGEGTTGENAAALTGSLGQQAATTAGGFSTSGAAASAAGQIGAANAFTAGANGIASGANNAALLTALNNGGMFGK